MHRSDWTGSQMMNANEFAMFGGDQVGYIREIDRTQAELLMPHLGHLPTDMPLFALHAADGSCMAIADTRDAVVANALEFDLFPVSVH